MVMDLLIRGRTKGKSSLDEVMRRMYDEFYLQSPNSSYYLRGRGYQTEDLERVIVELRAPSFTNSSNGTCVMLRSCLMTRRLGMRVCEW